jgi:hypothetical protein
MDSEHKDCTFQWHVLEEKSGDEASNYKEFHLLHDTGAMYTKVTFLCHDVIRFYSDFYVRHSQHIVIFHLNIRKKINHFSQIGESGLFSFMNQLL